MKKIILAAAVMVAVTYANTSHAVLIDSFAVNQGVGATLQGDKTANGLAVTSTNEWIDANQDPAPGLSLGTSSAFTDRTISVNKTAPPLPNNAWLNAIIDSGAANINSGTNIRGVVYFEWSTSGTAIDLTDAGNSDRFRLTFVAADWASTLTILATDSGGKTIFNTSTLTTPSGGNGDSFPSAFDVPFSTLTGGTGGSLADIKSLRFSFDLSVAAGDPDIAFEVFETTNNNVSTVPEPTSLALMGLGLIGCAAYCKKKPV